MFAFISREIPSILRKTAVCIDAVEALWHSQAMADLGFPVGGEGVDPLVGRGPPSRVLFW